MQRKLVFFIAIVVIILGGGVLSQLKLSLFKITQVSCQLNQQPCPQELNDSLQALLGKSLFFTKLEEEVYQQQLDFYQLAKLHKELPGTIHLEFVTKKNVYMVVLPDSSQYLVSESGLIQPTTEESPLTKIHISNHWSKPIQEHSLETPLHYTLHQLVVTLQTEKITPQKIEALSPDEIKITLDRDITAIVNEDGIESQVKKLAVIEKNIDLATVDTGIHTIDLRFRLPILKT